MWRECAGRDIPSAAMDDEPWLDPEFGGLDLHSGCTRSDMLTTVVRTGVSAAIKAICQWKAGVGLISIARWPVGLLPEAESPTSWGDSTNASK
jgi:hypothetical protein